MTVARVVKFGGSIIGDAERLRRAATILARPVEGPCLAVASAPGDWTDKLLGIARSGGGRFPSVAEARVLGLAEQVGASLLAAAVEACGREVRLVLPSDPGWPLHLSDDETSPIDWSKSRRAFVRLFADRDPERLVVIPGFVGLDASGRVRTLARGGGDTSAVIAARCLGSPELFLVKDVPGLLSADPRVVQGPETISEITVEDAALLAAAGAGVVAPEALACLSTGQTLRIVGLDQYDDPRAGTIVRASQDPEDGSAASAASPGPPTWESPVDCPASGAWTLVTGLLPSARSSGLDGRSGTSRVRAAPVHFIAPAEHAPHVVRSLHASSQFRALAHRDLASAPSDLPDRARLPGPRPGSSESTPVPSRILK